MLSPHGYYYSPGGFLVLTTPPDRKMFSASGLSLNFLFTCKQAVKRKIELWFPVSHWSVCNKKGSILTIHVCDARKNASDSPEYRSLFHDARNIKRGEGRRSRKAVFFGWELATRQHALYNSTWLRDIDQRSVRIRRSYEQVWPGGN